MEALHDFLLLYQEHFGQKIDVGKSAFLAPFSISEEHCRLVSAVLGFRKQPFSVKYLGVPLVRGRLGVVFFDPLLVKLRARLFH